MQFFWFFPPFFVVGGDLCSMKWTFVFVLLQKFETLLIWVIRLEWKWKTRVFIFVFLTSSPHQTVVTHVSSNLIRHFLCSNKIPTPKLPYVYFFPIVVLNYWCSLRIYCVTPPIFIVPVTVSYTWSKLLIYLPVGAFMLRFGWIKSYSC
jgi:hypothetical protein